MPRFSIVVVCTSPRPILDEYLRKGRLLKDDFAHVSFLSFTPVPSPLRAFEIFSRRGPAFTSLQYPVALVAKLIKSGSVPARRLESDERADGPS